MQRIAKPGPTAMVRWPLTTNSWYLPGLSSRAKNRLIGLLGQGLNRFEPPKEGVALVGWNCKATFPTGPKCMYKNELRWHDGYIVECKQLMQGGHAFFDYLLYFPEDTQCECGHGKELPHDSICFRKPNLANTKVGERAIAAAKAEIARREGAEHSDSGVSASGSGSARAMRERADWRS